MHKSIFLLVLFLHLSPFRADVSLPAIFGNHMVLQQEGKIPVWGWASPGESVKVAVGTSQAETQTAADGTWRVELPPLPTTSAPMTMTVTGKNSIRIEDVLVGEVWLASGQSNMSFALSWEPNAKELIAQANHPMMRVYEVENHPGIRPKKRNPGHWVVVTPESARNDSAVAYFFGRELQQKLNRPVGLIEASWGGTPIETWMSHEALEKIPQRAAALAQIDKEAAAFPQEPAEQEKAMNDWRARLSDWETTFQRPFEAAIKKWQADVEAAKASHQAPPREPDRPQGRPKNPDGQEGDCTTLFNGMINSLIPYAIKGAIWYQGEANTNMDERAYRALLGTMISDWRGRWNEGDFPFLIVGLANIDARLPVPSDNGWAEVRGAQADLAATMPNVGLAEAIDLGTTHNIHPPDKIDIGKRLGACAMHIAYGRDVTFAGPRFESMAIEGNKIRIKFTSVGSGIVLAASPYVCSEPPNDNPALSTTEPLGFEIAGADKKWAVAQAKIEGNDLVAWTEQIASPVAVRYAWSQNPPVNLYNKEGFPAVPFRTEDWGVAAR